MEHGIIVSGAPDTYNILKQGEVFAIFNCQCKEKADDLLEASSFHAAAGPAFQPELHPAQKAVQGFGVPCLQTLGGNVIIVQSQSAQYLQNLVSRSSPVTDRFQNLMQFIEPFLQKTKKNQKKWLTPLASAMAASDDHPYVCKAL